MNLFRFDYQYRNLIRFPVPAGSSLAMTMILNTALLFVIFNEPRQRDANGGVSSDDINTSWVTKAQDSKKNPNINIINIFNISTYMCMCI